MADDPSAILAGIREHNERVIALCGMAPAVVRQLAEHDVPRLLAAVEAALKPHEPINLYRSAEGCGHEPPVATNGRESAADYAPWDEWNGNHPHGTTADGGSGDRICLLTDIGTACPACSALVYGTWGDDDGFVSAYDCIVRPAVTRELTGKGDGDGRT